MPLTKCVRCDKLFNKISNVVCQPCLPDEDADFEIIRTTLEENPESNAEKIAELSGITIECVLRMLDTGMISNVSLGGGAIKCGQCGGAAISPTKKLCQNCLDKLNKKMIDTRKSIKMDARKKVEVGGYANVRDLIESKKR